jgi:EAL domain-containing protein (putative c-di-GMP-specific phosphodiesterase class I)
MKRRLVSSATLDHTAEFASICQRLRIALQPLFVHGVLLYDEAGALLWLTASFGPKEDEAVQKACEKFAGDSGAAMFAYDLGGARSAVLFRVTNMAGQMVGAAMIVLDTRIVRQHDGKLGELVTTKLLLALGYFASTRSKSTSIPPIPSSSGHTAPPFLTSLASTVSRSAPAANVAETIEATTDALLTRETPTATSPIEMDLSATSTLRILTARRHPDSIGPDSVQLGQKPPQRRPALSLVVQRLVPLREGVQPVRCEVLWALPSRKRGLEKDHAHAIPARQIRLPRMMERRALIELCRWVRQQSAGWRESMPFMWLKFSTDAALDKTFIHFVEQCLTRSRFPTDRLGFEIPAYDAAARAAELTKVATSLERLRCFIVIDNFTVQADHLDLLRLPAVRMIKFAPEITTAMRTDTWLQKRVAGTAQTTRALGIATVAKRIPSRSQALWYRDFGVEFVQSQMLSPGEPIAVLIDKQGRPRGGSSAARRGRHGT